MTAQEVMQKQADVVVIGGGIAGCASAYYLAKRGASVALVEKGRIGSEQSSRAWGFTLQSGRPAVEVPMMMQGTKLWEHLQEELGADVEWVQQGSLRLATDEPALARLEQTVKEERDIGLDVRILSKREVQELVPQMTGDWLGGMYCPTDGQAEPAKATAAFARAAQEYGAKIYTNCAANGIEVAGGRVMTLITELGEIRAPTVICAAGAWSSCVARMIGLNLPQRKVRSTVAATTPLQPITKTTVWGGGVSFRQKRDGAVYLAGGRGGGGAEYDVTLDFFRNLLAFLPTYRRNWRALRFHMSGEIVKDLGRWVPWSYARKHPFAHTIDMEPQPNPRKVEASREAFRGAFPFLSDVSIERSWAGYIDYTPDAVPVMGEVPTVGGLVMATGFSGHGFAKGPIVGKLTSELVLDGQTSVDLRPLRFSRFAEGAMHPVRRLT